MKLPYKILFIFLVTLFLNNSYLNAQPQNNDIVELENVVISPARFETGIDQVSSSVTVINSKDAEEKGINNVKDALAQTLGIDVSSSGSLKGDTSVFIRGSNANHTSLIIDGVKLYDPIVTSSYYNFAHLSMNNIDSIEIVRGTQSSLYGSDAIGGLINITTKKGEGKPVLKMFSSVGSFETFREVLGFSGQKDKFYYSLSSSREDSRGFSAADESEGNIEKDGYQNTHSSLRFDYDLNKDITIGTSARYTHSRFEYDDSGGSGGDDEDKLGWYDEGLAAAYIKQKLNRWWDYKINLGLTRIYRKDKDRGSGDYYDAFYDGKTYQTGFQNNFTLSEFNTVILGFDYLKEIGKSTYDAKKSAQTRGYFIENIARFPFGLNLSGSLRIEDHSTFGEETTYKLGANYKIQKTNTVLKTTYGTGFNAPSLYQLYGTYGGNVALKPEKSKSYDIGFIQYLFDKKIKAGSTYFHTELDNLIDYDWVEEGYQNTGKAKIEGIENFIDYSIKDNLKLSASYNYLRAINEDENTRLLRRADNKFILNLNYLPFKNLNLNCSLNYTGSRPDETGYPANTVKLKPFTVINLNGIYQVNESTDIFAKIENLFDKDYELVKGYQTTPFSFYVGISKTF